LARVEGAGPRPLVNHVGLTVADLDASIAFYVDTVGMRVMSRSATCGDWFDTLTSNQGAVIDVVMLESRQLVLQLVHYGRGGNAEGHTGHNRVGNVHLCINVEDVERKRAEILAGGRYRATPIVELPAPGMRSFYTADPDGIPVEFLQAGGGH
jgi:catechol 2,3-dioxygenase-like lactoylglutathione lyase family enzyme